MSRNLADTLKGVEVLELHGSEDQVITSLKFDSRKVEEGDCFFANKGTQRDGHEFIDQVIKAGAKVIVLEEVPKELKDGVTYVKVQSSAEVMGLMAANFYDHPSSKLKLVGVTGTNGKTTTVTLLHQLFLKLGHVAGLLSTVVNKIGDAEIPSTHTTPDAIAINALLQQMLDGGCTHCFMEVSSHAVVQHRVSGLTFSGGVFTNITHDHLDYHKTFDAYLNAKRAFFNLLPKTAFALSNRDDKNGQVMLQETEAKKVFYALRTEADYKTKIVENSFDGLSLKLDGHELWTAFVGKFNAYNLTAVYGVAHLLGEDSIQVLTALSTLRSVAGRFQHLKHLGRIGVVDYAHTPDALENVLNTIKGIRTGNEAVITIVGCGGDRDKTKRPIMAKIACQLSDRVILTSDNPRTEDPNEILKDMQAGVGSEYRARVLSISNRREAIRTAVSLSQEKDILLVAGKGHETYQEINGERHHFDDVEELENAFNELLIKEV